VLLVQAGDVDIVGVRDGATPLLYAYMVVSVIKSVQVRPCRETKLETHLGVAREVAVLFSVVTDRDCGKTAWARLVGGLDDQSHIRRVLDLEVQAVVPTSGLFENAKDGLHYAPFASPFTECI
jgi:hypothetical protein